jgi:uncharacterized membrane protein YedE/YeeE
MLELTGSTWPWYVAGPLIALVLFLMHYLGKTFGVSSTLRTGCAIGGAGKLNRFFCIDWRSELWNLVFVGGALVGGFISAQFLGAGGEVGISEATQQDLRGLGIENPGDSLAPAFFSWSGLTTPEGLIMVVLGGFLVGFGSRYAGGCTSGHAITGLSNLQWPSLVAVAGFFIGGLAVTHFLLPLIL